MRADENELEFPELQALLSTMALMIWGTTLTPARCAAMRNGDWAAVPVLLNNMGSFEGTNRVIMKMEMTSSWSDLGVYYNGGETNRRRA